MKRTNIRLAISFLWCIAALFVMMLHSYADDGEQPPAKFKVGDHVLVSPTGLKDDYHPGVILEVRDGVHPSYKAEVETGYGGTEHYYVQEAWVKPAPAVKKAADKKEPDKKAPDEGEAGNNDGQNQNDDDQRDGAKFKVGDHVLVSPTGLKDDYHPGVILEVRDGVHPSYKAEVETGYGGTERYSVQEAWVKPAPAVKKAADKKEPDKKAPDEGEAGNNEGQNQNDDAPTDGMKFKVGDRVEVDVLLRREGTSTYEKATVEKVDTYSKSYIVAVDPLPGKAPVRYSVPVRPYGLHWIRAIQGVDKAPHVFTEKLRVDANNTVLADRPLLGDFDRSGKNGVPPSQELAKKLVRSLWETPSPTVGGGATKVDIQSMTIGAPHKWQLGEDMGAGSLDTLVYPLYVKWNQKSYYRDQNIATTGREDHFVCFVDDTGLWQCGLSVGSRKDGTTQEIVVVP